PHERRGPCRESMGRAVRRGGGDAITQISAGTIVELRWNRKCDVPSAWFCQPSYSLDWGTRRSYRSMATYCRTEPNSVIQRWLESSSLRDGTSSPNHRPTPSS